MVEMKFTNPEQALFWSTLGDAVSVKLKEVKGLSPLVDSLESGIWSDRHFDMVSRLVLKTMRIGGDDVDLYMVLRAKIKQVGSERKLPKGPDKPSDNGEIEKTGTIRRAVGSKAKSK